MLENSRKYFSLESGNHDSLVYLPKCVYYRPPTKLREGSVFTGVCHSVQWGEAPMWPLPMMPPTSLYNTPLPVPHQTWDPWRPVRTCLCTPLGTTSGSGLWSTYDFQRAVRILLECFLVPCKLTKACYHCDTLCAHVLICAVHNVIQSKTIWPSRLLSCDLILRDYSWAWTFCT